MRPGVLGMLLLFLICSFLSCALVKERMRKKNQKRGCAKNWFPYNTFLRADVAQLVEHNLAKVGVAGSNPVVRSIETSKPLQLAARASFISGTIALFFKRGRGRA